MSGSAYEPDNQESLEGLFGTVFDLAEQVASRVGPEEIEVRLQRTLQDAASGSKPRSDRQLTAVKASAAARSGELDQVLEAVDGQARQAVAASLDIDRQLTAVKAAANVTTPLGAQTELSRGPRKAAAGARYPFRAMAPAFGILTALPEEFAAMRSFIDAPRRASVEGDRADYLLGTMPSADPGRTHAVALTLLGETGNDAAAGAGTNLLRSYPSVRCLLMAGIAAGIPDPGRPERHVRLGDIVVARGIVEYDSVRDLDDGPVFRRTFPPPSPLLQRRARMLQAGEMTGDRPWEDLLAVQTRLFPWFARPPESADVLHSSDGSGPVPHPDRALSGHRADQPKVHHGLIASGDRSLRSARKRDEIAAFCDVLAVEMEGKGIGNTGFYEGAEWFTVRGISDYGDRYVTTAWRGYASMAAAAYVRALLAVTPAAARVRQVPEGGHRRPAPAREGTVTFIRDNGALSPITMVRPPHEAGRPFA